MMTMFTRTWRRKRRLYWAIVGFLLVGSLMIYFMYRTLSKGAIGTRSFTRPGKLDEDYNTLDHLFGGDFISFNKMKEFRLGEEFMLETEKEALRAVVFPNIATEPSRKTSTLHLVYKNGTAPDHGNVTVRLDLRDASDRKIEYGGHQIRMWITSALPSRKSAAVRVTDLRNGSYLASFPVLWPGKTAVHAALIFSRDLHRVMTKTIVTLKNPQPLVGGFIRGDCKAATLCGPFLVIPRYQSVCNHTSLNSGLGWYCGKPTEECLSCNDLKLARRFKLRGFPRPYMPEAERKLYKWFNDSMWARRWILDMDHTLTFHSDARPSPTPRVPCSARKSRDTWNDQSPLGYLHGEKWHSSVCILPPWELSFADCLRRATIMFIGDSNARMMFENVCELVEGYVDESVLKAHIPLFCEKVKEDLNTNVTWFPHEYPFQGGEHKWFDFTKKKSARYRMDRIPSEGKYIVLVHLLAHFVNYPAAVYTEHVKDVVRGARDLCRRNPSAKIVVRGPSCWVNEVRGDYLATAAMEVLRREFQELQDCVMYLDSFDITLTAGGCNHVHPPTFATQEVTRLFMGHVCATV